MFMSRRLLSTFAITIIGCADTVVDTTTTEALQLTPDQVRNSNGIAETHSLLGSLPDLKANNAFFKNMGTTGRTCESCHGPAGGYTPSNAQELWDDSNGNDPLFQFTHDIGVCSDSAIAKKRDRKRAMKLALERGLTRGTSTIQPTWEFEIIAVDDPYDCSNTSLTTFNGYRKPNPSVGVSQKTSVTWAPAPQPDMPLALRNFVIGATKVHGLTDYTPTLEEQNQGADFMLFTYFAQVRDDRAGRLDDDGARGGPVHLSEQEWHVGINHASTGATTRKVFDIYDAWIGAAEDCGGGSGGGGGDDDDDDGGGNHYKNGHHDDDDDGHHGNHCRQQRRRALIAEGQEIFNFRENANGGTCSGCHNSPNVGTRSVYQLFDIGIVDAPDEDLVRVTLRNKTTLATRTVTNLGRAAATGLWSDIGRMAVPPLRGLSQRAPYFSSGQAKDLRAVVEHYNTRFTFNLTSHEKRALVAFLEAL
jgi:cytochrome c peroxidase